jgi:twinkle protein
VVAHPHKLRKEQDGNYPCPDVFDLADGAMWNNKMDNIIVYHRPNHQKDPNSSVCELHSKKIRRQKQVGKKGVLEFEYYRTQRRYYVNGRDVLGYALVEDPEINDIPF